MTKEDAVKKFTILKERGIPLANVRRGGQDFKKWYRDTQVAIEKVFGEGTRHSKDFGKISFSRTAFSSKTPDSAFEEAYQNGIRTAITILDSFIDEINEYWDDEESSIITELTSVEKVELLIRRFHKVARQLRARHSNRNTLEIEDEYDVQDLFHALLKIYFEDIRPEEYTPSYAGAASRVDFLLKQEQIIIEIKKTRKNLGAKEIGEQLIIDSQRYQAHPDCNQLICFVYDPEGRVANPRGIENDLTKEINGVPISVFITPEH